jgi:hypothetical protein
MSVIKLMLSFKITLFVEILWLMKLSLFLIYGDSISTIIMFNLNMKLVVLCNILFLLISVN